MDAKGAFAVSGPAVHVAQYPAAGRPGLGHRGNPARASRTSSCRWMTTSGRWSSRRPGCCATPSAGEAGSLRSDLLRSGRVRAIVRLQPGLLRAKPREAAGPVGAGTVLRGSAHRRPLDHGGRPEHHSAHRDVSQDLVSDVVASMGNRATIRAHSFRFARLVQTRVLLAGKGSLVQRPAPKRYDGGSAAPRQRFGSRNSSGPAAPAASSGRSRCRR